MNIIFPFFLFSFPFLLIWILFGSWGMTGSDALDKTKWFLRFFLSSFPFFFGWVIILRFSDSHFLLYSTFSYASSPHLHITPPTLVHYPLRFSVHSCSLFFFSFSFSFSKTKVGVRVFVIRFSPRFTVQCRDGNMIVC